MALGGELLMAITYVGAASAASNTVNLPTFTEGNIAFVIAYRTSSATIPTVPAGWTKLIDNTFASAQGAVTGYRVLNSSDTTIGTWTNAEYVGVTVYSDVHTLVIGENKFITFTATGSTASSGTGSMGSITPNYSTSVSMMMTIGTTSTINSAGFGTLRNGTGTRFGVADGPPANNVGSFVFAATNHHAEYGILLLASNPYPIVVDYDTTSGTVTSNSSSWTLTYPTNIAAGDLLLAFLSMDGGAVSSPTWPAGWAGSTTGWTSTANTLLMRVKNAAGSETGTFSVTGLNSEQGAWAIWRIPAGTWYGVNVLDNVATANATTSNANPDPPSLDPANWGTENTLWFAVMSADTSRTVSAYPSSPDTFTNTGSLVSGGTGGATLAWARLEKNASSVDPGTFTISSSDDWVAATIAIRPRQFFNVSAQAQAQIATGGATTYRAYSQSQARIKQTYTTYAQSQARIKQTYQGYAQANTHVKISGINAHAQGQAHIKQTYQGFAQGQSQIKQTYPFGSGASTLAIDTFTESSNTALTSHTPDTGGPWTAFYNYSGQIIVNAASDYAVLDGAFSPTSGTGYRAQGVAISSISDGYIQGYLDNSQSNYPAFIIKRTGASTYYMLSNNNLYRVISGASTSLGGVGGSGNWYRFQATGSNPTYLKIERRTAENLLGTGWGLETTDSVASNQTTTGDAGLYLLDSYNFDTSTPSPCGYVDSITTVEIGNLTGPTFAQGQANIKQNYLVFAQSKATIKSIYQAYAQADALIISTAQAYAQSQGHIRITSLAYAQTQAQVKQKSLGYAQASVWIKQTYPISIDNVYAYDTFTDTSGTVLSSHTADIGGTWVYIRNAGGQIQGNALVKPSGTFTSAGSALNSPLVNGEVILTIDPTNPGGEALNFVGVLGRATSLLGNNSNYYEAIITNYGSTLKIRRHLGQTELASVSIGISDKLKFYITGSSPTYLYAKAWATQIWDEGLEEWVPQDEPSSWNISISDNNAINQTASGYVGVGYGTPNSINQSVQLDNFRAFNVIQEGPTYAQSQAQIKTSYTKSAQSQARIKTTYQAYAQAQSQIQQTYQGYAQSEASISLGIQIYQAYAQSEASILATSNAFAQAQAQMLGEKVTYSTYAQVQSSLKVTDNVTFAQVEAQIKQTYQGYAQTQSAIKQTYAGYAQAQASLKAVGRGFGQASVWIKQTYPFGGSGQIIGYDTFTDTNGTLLTAHTPEVGTWTNRFSASGAGYHVINNNQAKGNLDFSPEDGNGFGYSDRLATLGASFADGYAEAQLLPSIGEPKMYIRHPGTNEQKGYYVKENTLLRTSSTISVTSLGTVGGTGNFYRIQVTGYSPTYIKVERRATLGELGTGWTLETSDNTAGLQIASGYAGIQFNDSYDYWEDSTAQNGPVDSFKISTLSTIEGPTFAQSQAQIKTSYTKSLQAQAKIKSTYQGYAQVQSQIKAVYQSAAQSQAQIKAVSVVAAQAQAQLKQSYQGYAQAEASILLASNVHAQANAAILAVSDAYAQAEARILGQATTYEIFAQAQAGIKTEYQAYAQSQSTIMQTYLEYAQTQAHIKNTYQGYAQSQSHIKTIENTTFAQAQAYILATSQGFAQAEATIKAVGNSHAQALAYIYIPVIAYPVADISNNGWVRVVI
jgi:hypothetical protein